MPEIFWQGFYMCLQKLTKEITEKLQNPIAKWFQKSYNMVTARAQALLSVKSFSSCFLGYRAQVLLLRLFSFTVVIHVPHRRYPASCAKKLVRSGRAFLHPQITQKPAPHAGKYDLTPFWWAICLFFCKGHLQSLARRGFVFRLALWYSIYNQFIGCKHESD